MTKYYEYDEHLELFNYYNRLIETEKSHHQSITTNSSYHYFVKDEQLYELRISDHAFTIPINEDLGYSIIGIDCGTAIELGTTFLEERFRNKGHVIKSDKYLTTIQYSDKKVTYSTKYVNDRYEMIAIFEKGFKIENIYNKKEEI